MAILITEPWGLSPRSSVLRLLIPRRRLLALDEDRGDKPMIAEPWG
jgi:hypothetical protein